jgi:hypothetical protein
MTSHQSVPLRQATWLSPWPTVRIVEDSSVIKDKLPWQHRPNLRRSQEAKFSLIFSMLLDYRKYASSCNLQSESMSRNMRFCRLRYSNWLSAGRARRSSSSPGRVKNFLFSTSSRPALGSTQPPIQWAPGTLSPRANRPGREADHSPPASAEVKKMWIYTFIPSYAFMSYCLIS